MVTRPSRGQLLDIQLTPLLSHQRRKVRSRSGSEVSSVVATTTPLQEHHKDHYPLVVSHSMNRMKIYGIQSRTRNDLISLIWRCF